MPKTPIEYDTQVNSKWTSAMLARVRTVWDGSVSAFIRLCVEKEVKRRERKL